MLQGIVNSISLIRHTLRTFFRYPQLVIPLLISWLVYAPTVLYLEYTIPWRRLEYSDIFLVVFCAVVILSFTLSISCLVLLEMVQQVESGQKISIWRAFVDAVFHDLPKALPIIFVWAIIWAILAIILAIFSKRDDDGDEERSLTVESAARTLSGSGNRFSLTGSFIRSLNKSLRMAVFLIFPSIAWENVGPREAAKRGMRAIRIHLSEFSSSFVLSGLVAFAVFLPPMIMIQTADTFDLSFSGRVWAIVLIYCGFAWSFAIFVEQMFAGELYLWHLKWEKAGRPGMKSKKRVNKLELVERPSLLDNVPELVQKRRSTRQRR